MTLWVLKLIQGISGCLFCAAMFLAYLTAPQLGSVYLALVAPFGNELPMMTSGFSLPMLRVHPAEPSLMPIDAGWVSVVWGAIIMTPIVIMLWSITAPNMADSLVRWSAGFMLYLPAVLCLAIAIILGLLISLAHI
jgi:hypothetical protein